MWTIIVVSGAQTFPQSYLIVVSQLIPEASDYIASKLKHSAFYATPLDTLFSYLKVKTVILAGLITNACILSTASDLYVRDLDVCVPSDCVATPIKRAVVMRLSS